MPCLKCKKKGIPMICKYCNLGFCSRCILLEMHDCSGAELKKQDTLKNLKRPSYKFEALGFKGVFEG